MCRLIFVLIALSASLFCHADDWKRVYLASYPCSGNHWFRAIFEEITNVATSSVYRDQDHPIHLHTHFPWGGFAPEHGYDGTRPYPTNKDLVLIKTHYPALRARIYDNKPYRKVIRIVRHPIDCIYSFALRQKKVDALHPRIQRQTLKKLTTMWAKFQTHWNKQPNVITILYEKLLTKPQEVLEDTFKQLGLKVSRKKIQEALKKHPPVGTVLKHLQHFTPGDIWFFKRNLDDLLTQFHYNFNEK
jgi:hypothetical protein